MARAARPRPDGAKSKAERDAADGRAVRQYQRVLELKGDAKLALSEGIREIREEALARVELPAVDEELRQRTSEADRKKYDEVAKLRRRRLEALRGEERQGRKIQKLKPGQKRRKEEVQSDVSAVERFKGIMRDCEAFTGMKIVPDESESAQLGPQATPKRQHGQDLDSDTQPSQFCLDDPGADPDAPPSAATPKGKRQLSTSEPVPDLDPLSAPRLVQGKNPPYLGGVLRPYQVDGVNWLLSLHHQCLGGILADEMGLGKTFQTIALLACLKYGENIEGPHLIMCPRSVLGNWNREFARFAPGMKVLMYHANADSRRDMRHELEAGGFDVVLSTWEQVRIDLRYFKRLRLRYLVLDEGHKIKNEESQVSQTVRALACTNRLILTGTPLQNNLRELWALLNFLLPDLFDDVSTFSDWFDCVTGSSEKQVMDQLHHMLTPFMLRRIKDEADAGIPPKKEVYVACKLSKMQKTWYQGVLAKDLSTVTGNASSDSLSNIMMHLRKVCNHPYLFSGAEEPEELVQTDERIVKNSGKLVVLDKLLKKLFAEPKATRQKVLIFSQFTSMLNILCDYLEMRRWKYCRLDGNTSGEMRDLQMNDFNSPDSDKQVFLLSTRAGGLGINLQAASVVVLFDSDWNPQADLQAMDRAHRIGQKRPVTVYRFIVDGTVEERMYQRALKKLYLDAIVVQQGNLANRKKLGNVTKDELRGMIKWGAAAIFKGGDGGDDEDIENVDIDAIMEMGAKLMDEKQKQFEQTQQQTLKSFQLGINEGNMYEFEGVDYTTKPTKGIYVEIHAPPEPKDAEKDAEKGGKEGKEGKAASKGAAVPKGEIEAPDAFEAAFKAFAKVSRVVVSPTLTQAIIEFKDLSDAIRAKGELDGKPFAGVRGVLSVRYGTQSAGVSEEMRSMYAQKFIEQEEQRRAAAAAKREADEEKLAAQRKEAEAAMQEINDVAAMPKFKRHPQHQFFDNDRLEYLHDREWKARLERKRSGGDTVNCLSPDEAAERERLLAAGFPKWSMQDVHALVRAMGEHGRENYAAISASLSGGFTAEEVEAYAKALWEKGPTHIEKFEAIRERVERREEQRRKAVLQQKALTWKLTEAEGRAENMFSPTAPVAKTGLPQSAVDRYFLGYAVLENDHWDAVAHKVQAAPEFFLDFGAQAKTNLHIAAAVRRHQSVVLKEYQQVHGEPDGAPPAGTRGRKRRRGADTPQDEAPPQKRGAAGGGTAKAGAKKRSK